MTASVVPHLINDDLSSGAVLGGDVVFGGDAGWQARSAGHAPGHALFCKGEGPAFAFALHVFSSGVNGTWREMRPAYSAAVRMDGVAGWCEGL
eukprot:2754363-Prymnesium_polylepis.1